MGTLSVEANNNHRGGRVCSKTGYHGDTAGSAPWHRLVGTLVLGCLLALLRLLRSGSSSARKIEVLPLERKGEPNLADCSTTPIDPPTAPNGVTKSARLPMQSHTQLRLAIVLTLVCYGQTSSFDAVGVVYEYDVPQCGTPVRGEWMLSPQLATQMKSAADRCFCYKPCTGSGHGYGNGTLLRFYASMPATGKRRACRGSLCMRMTCLGHSSRWERTCSRF